jgi:hypothetical protein
MLAADSAALQCVLHLAASIQNSARLVHTKWSQIIYFQNHMNELNTYYSFRSFDNPTHIKHNTPFYLDLEAGGCRT